MSDKKETLRDWLPHEALSYTDDAFYKHLDVEVIEDKEGGWPGKHKNVYHWCILKNGVAVGWNENPSVGWAFPIKKVNRIRG